MKTDEPVMCTRLRGHKEVRTGGKGSRYLGIQGLGAKGSAAFRQVTVLCSIFN